MLSGQTDPENVAKIVQLIFIVYMCDFDYINTFMMKILVLPSDLFMITKIIIVATRIKEQSDTINPKNL